MQAVQEAGVVLTHEQVADLQRCYAALQGLDDPSVEPVLESMAFVEDL